MGNKSERAEARLMQRLFDAVHKKVPADLAYSAYERAEAIRSGQALEPVSLQSQADIEYDNAQIVVGYVAHEKRKSIEPDIILDKTASAKTPDQAYAALRRIGALER